MTSEPQRSWRGTVTDGVDAWTRRVAEPPPADPVGDGPEADPEQVARKILLDQLTGQARSRAELRAKLAARNVPGELAERLLDRFTEVGLVDDRAFARAWVESRQAGKGLAPRALAHELRRKGVADEVAREALAGVGRDQQEEAARVLVRKRLRSMRGVEPAVATRRLVGMLARKGYDSALAFAVVRAELAGAEDLDSGTVEEFS
ncbi:MAG: regulatory protein RecX [Nocardioides sp.]